ncbi:hypothetical protein PAMC26577_17260 [Caballeronia sordidicola]|uniref:Uncharacterized protein n=1 Tax=Caballeronia sordidicola TaxID=196367 RepID=A0A242MR84_CABSO|nr:hypothetical protein PAMC26577_17260 [Caballeronia sordidicola]
MRVRECMLAATNNQGIPHLLIERVERFALGSMPWSTCQVYIHKSRHLSQAMKQLLIPLQEKNRDKPVQRTKSQPLHDLK